MFWKISNYLSVEARKIFCNSYILPYLDYCCTIWGNTTQANLSKLFRLQKYAARLIFSDFDSPSNLLFKHLDWLPFHLRIEYNKLILVYKSLSGLAPQYMSDRLKFVSKNQYCTRSALSDQLYIPKFRTELFKKSLVFSGAKLWNHLPNNIKSCGSLNKFKHLCFQFLNRQWQNSLR